MKGQFSSDPHSKSSIGFYPRPLSHPSPNSEELCIGGTGAQFNVHSLMIGRLRVVFNRRRVFQMVQKTECTQKQLSILKNKKEMSYESLAPGLVFKH